MAKRRGQRRRAALTAMTLLTVLALICAAAAAWLGQGKAYRLELAVDCEKLSPSLEGLAQREGLALAPALTALQTDETADCARMLDAGGALLPKLEPLRTLLGQLRACIREETDGGTSLNTATLGTFDRACAQAQTLVEKLTQALATARRTLSAVTVAAGVGLLAAAVLLFLKKISGAATVCALTALLIGCVPLLLLSAAGGLFRELESELAVAERFGVGVHASVRLTGSGTAQVLLAAAAILLAACGRMAYLYMLRRRRRSASASQN